jgi:hypothetical protein
MEPARCDIRTSPMGKKAFFGLLILFTRMPFDGKNATGSKLREVKTPKEKEKYDPSDF